MPSLHWSPQLLLKELWFLLRNHKFDKKKKNLKMIMVTQCIANEGNDFKK